MYGNWSHCVRNFVRNVTNFHTYPLKKVLQYQKDKKGRGVRPHPRLPPRQGVKPCFFNTAFECSFRGFVWNVVTLRTGFRTQRGQFPFESSKSFLEIEKAAVFDRIRAYLLVKVLNHGFLIRLCTAAKSFLKNLYGNWSRCIRHCVRNVTSSLHVL